MDFKNKNVLVCGLGRSGIASAIILKKLGALVSASDIDINKKEVLFELDKDKNINFYLQDELNKKIILEQELIILSPGIKLDLFFLDIARENNIKIWSEIELAYRILEKNIIIGITGTNGKTTTTSLVGEIIKKYDKNCVVAGNIGVAMTQKILDLDLFDKNNKNNLFVTEISSFQLENIDLFKPKISAILNITPDHLDYHKSYEKYIFAKSKIFMNQDQNDFCVLNFDDKLCRELASKSRAKIIFFSLKNKLESGVYLDGDKIIIRFKDLNKAFMTIKKINLLGEHNLANVLASIAICICLNVPLEIIYNGIINFKAVEHRLEFVREINKIKFYNDSKATNVDSAIKALESIKNNNIILIGGGYDKKIDFYEWIKRFNRVKKLILIGQVKYKIAKQCDELGFKNYILCDDFEEAIKKSFELAEKNDYVLLSPACASWDMFKSFEERGNLFKKIVMSF